MTDNDLIECLGRDLDASLAVNQRLTEVGIGLADIALSLTDQLDAALSNVRSLKATVEELQDVIRQQSKQDVTVRAHVVQIH